MSVPPPSSFPGEPPVDGAAPTKGGPRVIAVGGGAGGAGKSLLAVNLAVYLAQLGRTAVLCDVDPGGSGLHTMIGLDPPEAPLKDCDEKSRSRLIPTAIPGLSLLPAVYEPTGALLAGGRRPRWLSRIRELPADYVMVDLGSGIARTSLDLFGAADVGVVVTSPEPPAIEATYR
ncbi:MAG TPA: P-loop NTPase, partial [Polyangiaceae bacterium]